MANIHTIFFKLLFIIAIIIIIYKAYYYKCKEDFITKCNESLTQKGEDYRGCQKTTISGKTCQPWNCHLTNSCLHEGGTANTIKTKWTDENWKFSKGIGSHNYCRNPDGEDSIWCYTNDPRTRWEKCTPIKHVKDKKPLISEKDLKEERNRKIIEEKLKDKDNILTGETAACYANRYPELKKECGYLCNEYLRDHWKTIGKNEKRNPYCGEKKGGYINNKDIICYSNRYEDLSDKCAQNCGSFLQNHWLLNGQKEKKNNKCCEFVAYGRSKDECISTCKSKKNMFESKNCTNNDCERICNQCTDKKLCSWLLSPNDDTNFLNKEKPFDNLLKMHKIKNKFHYILRTEKLHFDENEVGYYFDGYKSDIRYTDLDFDTYTIKLFFKKKDNKSNCVLAYSSSANFIIYLSPIKNSFQVICDYNNNILVSNDVINLIDYNFLAFSVKHGTIKLHVNNSQQVKNITNSKNIKDLTIGSDTSTKFFRGHIGKIEFIDKFLNKKDYCKNNIFCNSVKLKTNNLKVQQKHVPVNSPNIKQEIKKCNFNPHGSKKLDCYNKCLNTNGCSNGEECVDICDKCQDKDRCHWLTKSKIFDPPNIEDIKRAQYIKEQMKKNPVNARNTDAAKKLIKKAKNNIISIKPESIKVMAKATNKEIKLLWLPPKNIKDIKQYIVVMREKKTGEKEYSKPYLFFPSKNNCKFCEYSVPDVEQNIDYKFGVVAIANKNPNNKNDNISDLTHQDYISVKLKNKNKEEIKKNIIKSETIVCNNDNTFNIYNDNENPPTSCVNSIKSNIGIDHNKLYNYLQPNPKYRLNLQL